MTTPASPPQPRRKVRKRWMRVPAPVRYLLGLVASLHRLAESGWGGSACAAWGFANGVIVPGPADALLVPLGLADPRRAYTLAWWTLAGAIPGGIVAYAIGALAYGEIALPLIERFGATAQFDLLQREFERSGWVLLGLAALPGLSTKWVAIAAGTVGFPFLPFVMMLSIARIARFMVVATLLRFAGHRATAWVERRYGISILDRLSRGTEPRTAPQSVESPSSPER